jgi:hypothetical protein
MVNNLMSEEYFLKCNEGHKFFDRQDNEYRAWLNKNIGRQNWQFYGPGTTHPSSIRFENREDAVAFRLYFNL